MSGEYVQIPGFEYEACTNGTINRLGARLRPLRPGKTRGGDTVSLYKDGKAHQVKVKNVMMMAWKPREYAGMASDEMIDHINGDDNRLENLRISKKRPTRTKSDVPTGTRKSQLVNELDEYDTFVRTHDSASAAARALGVHQPSIALCLVGKQKFVIVDGRKTRWKYHVKTSDTDLPDEAWVNVGDDFVSNMGRHKRRRGDGSFHNVQTPADMNVSRTNGYPFLTHGGKPREIRAIVADAFVPKPDAWTEGGTWIVKHIDGNNMNAAASNLMWVTRTSRMLESISDGKFVHFTRAVRQLDTVGNALAEFGSVKLAAASDPRFTTVGISECITGKIKTHPRGEYVWEAIESPEIPEIPVPPMSTVMERHAVTERHAAAKAKNEAEAEAIADVVRAEANERKIADLWAAAAEKARIAEEKATPISRPPGTIECSRCGKYVDEDLFVGKDGKSLKMCQPCRDAKYASNKKARETFPGGTVRETDGKVKCSHCPRWCVPDSFVSDDGSVMKRCVQCRVLGDDLDAKPGRRLASYEKKALARGIANDDEPVLLLRIRGRTDDRRQGVRRHRSDEQRRRVHPGKLRRVLRDVQQDENVFGRQDVRGAVRAYFVSPQRTRKPVRSRGVARRQSGDSVFRGRHGGQAPRLRFRLDAGRVRSYPDREMHVLRPPEFVHAPKRDR